MAGAFTTATATLLWRTGRAPRWFTLSGTVIAVVLFFALYLIILPRIYGFSTNGRFLDLLALAIPFILSVSFLGQFVSLWFKRGETAVLLFLASSLPLFFLVGVSWPVEAIPGPLRLASLVFPSTSAIDGLVRINQMGATLNDVFRDWTVLWALAALYGLLTVLAARFFVRERTSDGRAA